MKLTSKWYWLSLLPVLATVSFYVAKHATFHLKAYAQVSATPFVAETVYYDFRSNPQGELFFKKVIARRSDGSTAEVSRKGPVWGASFRSVSFLNGMTLHAFDLISSKTTFKRDTKQLAALKERLTNPPADCMYWPNAKVIDRRILFGQQFVVLQKKDTNNDRSTRWMAPQLGCESLQWRLENPHPDGSYKLQTEERLISLEAAKEPDHAFFDPAANYEEAMPSEIIRRHYEKIGQPEPTGMQRQGQKADTYVQQHKQ